MKRKATRTVTLTDTDRLAHVHPRHWRNGPTHVCERCGAESYLRAEAAFAVGFADVGCACGGRIVPSTEEE